MKFKDWFSIKGIRAEAKHVTWLKRKELFKNTGTVLAFCILFGIFFFASDAIIAMILRLLRIS